MTTVELSDLMCPLASRLVAAHSAVVSKPVNDTPAASTSLRPLSADAFRTFRPDTVLLREFVPEKERSIASVTLWLERILPLV